MRSMEIEKEKYGVPGSLGPHVSSLSLTPGRACPTRPPDSHFACLSGCPLCGLSGQDKNPLQHRRPGS